MRGWFAGLCADPARPVPRAHEEASADLFDPGAGPVEQKRTARLKKGKRGFGFNVLQRVGARGALVVSLIPNSPADECGLVFVGDCVLAVNGQDVQGLPFSTIVKLIITAGKQIDLDVITDPRVAVVALVRQIEYVEASIFVHPLACFVCVVGC